MDTSLQCSRKIQKRGPDEQITTKKCKNFSEALVRPGNPNGNMELLLRLSSIQCMRLIFEFHFMQNNRVYACRPDPVERPAKVNMAPSTPSTFLPFLFVTMPFVILGAPSAACIRLKPALPSRIFFSSHPIRRARCLQGRFCGRGRKIDVAAFRRILGCSLLLRPSFLKLGFVQQKTVTVNPFKHVVKYDG